MTLTFKELVQNLPFIIPSYTDPPYLQEVMILLQKLTGSKIKQTLEVNTSDSVMMNISLGFGYSLLPSSWTELLSENNKINFVSLPQLHSYSKIVAVRNRNSSSNLAAAVFRLLKEQF